MEKSLEGVMLYLLTDVGLYNALAIVVLIIGIIAAINVLFIYLRNKKKRDEKGEWFFSTILNIKDDIDTNELQGEQDQIDEDEKLSEKDILILMLTYAHLDEAVVLRKYLFIYPVVAILLMMLGMAHVFVDIQAPLPFMGKEFPMVILGLMSALTAVTYLHKKKSLQKGEEFLVDFAKSHDIKDEITVERLIGIAENKRKFIYQKRAERFNESQREMKKGATSIDTRE